MEKFYWDEAAIFVSDTSRDTLLPYALGPDLHRVVSDFRPGAAPPRALPAKTVDLLRLAHVLVNADEIGWRAADWTRTLAHGAEQFVGGFATLTDLIHPFHIGALAPIFSLSDPERRGLNLATDKARYAMLPPTKASRVSFITCSRRLSAPWPRSR